MGSSLKISRGISHLEIKECNCQNCGAPLNWTKRINCAYCGSDHPLYLIKQKKWLEGEIINTSRGE